MFTKVDIGSQVFQNALIQTVKKNPETPSLSYSNKSASLLTHYIT